MPQPSAPSMTSMLDWKGAFENQCHFLGVQSFIDNNVRKSLIPTLISFFQRRKLTVKWKNEKSASLEVKGGGPQGGNLGILEYISQTKGNFDFLADEEAYKFVDDASFLEVINLLSVGLASLNAKNHVASDLPPEMAFLPPKNAETQHILDKMSKWRKDKKMVVSAE